MYLVVIAWLYVTVMMAVAEMASPSGSVVAGLGMLLFYALLPVGLLLYIVPRLRRKRGTFHRDGQAEKPAVKSEQARDVKPDAGGKTTAATQGERIAPVREEL